MDARQLGVVEREPRRSRRSKHRPADRLAALLSARDATLASEELTLRARADLECGRDREAALQLEAALLAALSELEGWRTLGDLEGGCRSSPASVDGVRAAAAAARAGTLERGAVEVVSAALSRLEAALRARALYVAQSL